MTALSEEGARPTTGPPDPAAPAGPAPRLPGLVRVAAARTRLEFLSFVRERSAMVFTFVFPLALLVIFGSALHGQPVAAGVDYEQYFVAGMIASGMFGCSFQNLAIVIPLERDIGGLKRLAGTPMPKSAYFAGKIMMVAFTASVQTVLLIVIGVLFYDLTLPKTVGPWLTFLWVAGLGTIACTLLGIGVAGIVKNGRTAPAVVSPLATVLQFVSGVFFVFATLPSWMQGIGALFPLKWMTQGMRSVFLPDSFAAHEVAGSWEHGRIALVLGGWCLVGLFVAVRTFRWRNRADG
ncbi:MULTISPECIES: ABC transporter permease [Micromonospora]|uniref:Transport permease protein n=1 Tax=Micromonospora humida TaxID=2809018 RepID=A0ABS2IUM5_9ACTN|nr:ABC transporter permease [Micromonospora humida]MBM7077224.1 ABC transporter permease [Micromonospora humida]